MLSSTVFGLTAVALIAVADSLWWPWLVPASTNGLDSVRPVRRRCGGEDPAAAVLRAVGLVVTLATGVGILIHRSLNQENGVATWLLKHGPAHWR